MDSKIQKMACNGEIMGRISALKKRNPKSSKPVADRRSGRDRRVRQSRPFVLRDPKTREQNYLRREKPEISKDTRERGERREGDDRRKVHIDKRLRQVGDTENRRNPSNSEPVSTIRVRPKDYPEQWKKGGMIGFGGPRVMGRSRGDIILEDRRMEMRRGADQLKAERKQKLAKKGEGSNRERKIEEGPKKLRKRARKAVSRARRRRN